jgi:type II secretory pathway pseudopilin PulG
MKNISRKNIRDLESTNLLNKKGFSLIEVMGALFIVMVGMVGVMSLVLQNIQVKDVNTNRIIAHQLAQEGIELIRKQRDTNWIDCSKIPSPAPDCWLSNIEPDFSYKIDFNDGYPEQVTSIEEARLYKDANNMYVHDYSPQETPFYRMIEVNYINEYSVYITATVNWQERAETYSYSAETVLYNWK